MLSRPTTPREAHHVWTGRESMAPTTPAPPEKMRPPRDYRVGPANPSSARRLTYNDAVAFARRRESMSASVVSIVYKPEHLPSRPPGHYTREPLAEAELVAGRGIRGDRKAGTGERHINLMAAETLEQLATEGFKTGPGEMGEQIVVRGLDLAALKPGDRVRLGAEVVLEVVKPRTG